jgi:putative transposase
MPRIARIAPRDQVFHILTRGNNRQDIFRDEIDYQQYFEILDRYKERYQFKLYHYVLMKNHVHLVLETQEEGGDLAEIMKGINLSYAQHYKRKYDHVGHFWQDRYKSILISKDQYLLACGSYVELNPVRAGLVRDPKDYRWSSYLAYGYGRKDSLVDEHSIYQELSKKELERRKRYREFVKGMLGKKDAMRGEMDRRAIYGGEIFVSKLRKKYKVEEVIKPIGRPKKKDKN